jgi:hypothetical protein
MKKQYAVIKKTGEVIGERQRLNPDDFKQEAMMEEAIMSSDLACNHIWKKVRGNPWIKECKFCGLCKSEG